MGAIKQLLSDSTPDFLNYFLDDINSVGVDNYFDLKSPDDFEVAEKFLAVANKLSSIVDVEKHQLNQFKLHQALVGDSVNDVLSGPNE